MRAVRLVQWEGEPELVEIPAPTPGPGAVLIEVDAAGLCHTDLHLMRWPEGTVDYDLPFTLGHEIAGTVAALGPGTTGVSEGERVVVFARWGCGACWACVQGMENLCVRTVKELGGHGAGVGRDGGLAEYMVAPSARYLVRIDDLDPVIAAPLTDAALTPYHAIKRSSGQLRPDTSAVVIGVGGLGHMAIQLLRTLRSVRVVAVDVREDALRLARDVGAHAALPAKNITPHEVRSETGRAGATLVLDCVASDTTLALAAGIVAQGGDISYIGRGGGSLPIAPGRLPLECSVIIPTWGTLSELAEVVALARGGAIHTEVERFTLDETLDAYRRLHRGEVVGRAVVTPRAP
jgi:propanol-preferring alcohol dehydrogenase